MSDERSAAADAADYFLDRAIKSIDGRFGDGYARAEPKLVSTYILAASHAQQKRKAAGAIDRRSGGNGMKEGDRIVHEPTGHHGVAGEFLQDGDVCVTFDDGSSGMVKWNSCRPE